MTRKVFLMGAAACASLVYCGSGGVARADTPSTLSDLVGVRASTGESALQGRGYENVRTQAGSERKWSYWWNGSSKSCVTVTTYNGLYETIENTPNTDCNQSSSDGSKTAAIVGAAAVIGAIALIASKDNDKDKDNRNYNDRYGTGTPHDLKNIVGDKASSGEERMRNHGYRFIRTETGRNAKRSYWWNGREDRCVEVTTRDGRYDDIQGTSHRDCNQSPGRSYGASNSYSPAHNITCYPAQRACYEKGRGYSAFWSSREFRY